MGQTHSRPICPSLILTSQFSEESLLRVAFMTQAVNSLSLKRNIECFFNNSRIKVILEQYNLSIEGKGLIKNLQLIDQADVEIIKLNF